jgi:hypothetical protein
VSKVGVGGWRGGARWMVSCGGSHQTLSGRGGSLSGGEDAEPLRGPRQSFFVYRVSHFLPLFVRPVRAGLL